MTITELIKLTIDSYTGGGGFLDGSYLVPHEAESDIEVRKKVSYYSNHIRGMVTSLTAPIFGDKITRNCSDKLYNSFLKNCDRRGTTLSAWLEVVASYHALLGNVFIIMDTSSNPADTVQKAINSRSYPYVYYKLPCDAQDVRIDDTGKVSKITFYLDSKEIGGVSRNINRTIENGVIKDWYVDGKNVLYIGEPIYTAGHTVFMTGQEPIPMPPFGSLAQIAKAHYNANSEARDLNRAQGFAILQLPCEVPDASVVVGPRNVISIPKDSNRDCKYISPDANVTQFLGMEATRISEDMKDAARNLGITVIEKHYKSGTALTIDYAPVYAVLAGRSDLFEDVEERIRSMFSSMVNYNVPCDVMYSRDYSPTTDKLHSDYTILIEALSLPFEEGEKASIRELAYKNLQLITGLGAPSVIEEVEFDA